MNLDRESEAIVRHAMKILSNKTTEQQIKEVKN